MIIVNADYEVITENDPLKKIERIARVCYKSEDKITDGSDIKMVRSLIDRKHTAMLEHANIIIEVPKSIYVKVHEWVSTVIESQEMWLEESRYIDIKNRIYLRFTKHEKELCTRYLISGNIRAWYDYFRMVYSDKINDELYVTVNEHIQNVFNIFDMHLLDMPKKRRCRIITDITELSSDERMVHEDISIRFTVDRGITHELVRMREASFAQESTRYCNYANNKFGRNITFIEPCFWNNEKMPHKYDIWKTACENAEKSYFDLIDSGAQPQEARDVLLTSVKSEIVVTANLIEWHHILALRACDSTGPAHPQMHEIMIPVLCRLKYTHPFAFGGLVPKTAI